MHGITDQGVCAIAEAAGAAGAAAGFTVETEGLRAANAGLGHGLLAALGTARDLGSLTVDAAALAGIGAPVAEAREQLAGHTDTALDLVVRALGRISDEVQQSLTGYEQADRAAAEGFGTGGNPTTEGTDDMTTRSDPSGLWNDPAASRLAAHVSTQAAGPSTDPASVSTVLSYLHAAGLAPGTTATPTRPRSLADWLDADPSHQTQVGVINVYAGRVRDLGDIPGGVRGGDVVVVTPSTVPTHDLIAVATDRGHLVNHGLVRPDFSAGADVRVYRPITAFTSPISESGPISETALNEKGTS